MTQFKAGKREGDPRTFTNKRRWGNRIEWLDHAKKKITGWMPERPMVGDRLEEQMQSGRVGVFEFIEVTLMTDPPDMFFAILKPIAYKDEL